MHGQATEVPADLSAQFGDPEYPDEWPAGVPTAVRAGSLCAVLHPAPSSDARVSLATSPTGAADPGGEDPISPGRHDVDVAPSAGAYVLAGSDEAADGGTPYVIDTKGAKYLLGPNVSAYIGYEDVAPPLVPSTWMAFFDRGVALTTNSARRVPEDAPPPDSDEDG